MIKRALLAVMIVVGICTFIINVSFATDYPEVEYDFHKYDMGSLMDKNLPVRSAEFKVISQCWGGNCGTVMNMAPMSARQLDVDFNMNLVPNNNDREGKVEFSVRLEGGKTFKHWFMLRYYYAQDIPKNAYEKEPYEEIISILTEKNYEEFKNDIVDPWVSDAYQDVEDEFGNVIVDNSAKRREARILIKEAAKKFVNGESGAGYTLPNGGYARIGVITEGFAEKDFFIYEPNAYAIDTTIFAQTPGGMLVGIKTDEYNEIYRQGLYEPVPNATDVEQSKTSPDQLNKKQYRIDDVSFYLCQECAICDEGGCQGFVASGHDWNEIGQYFSLYCGEHACRFVWEWDVDLTNANGMTAEGLKCKKKRSDGFSFCMVHKCGNTECERGIVGVSEQALWTGSVPDIRATCMDSIGAYSAFCADHKCRSVGCHFGCVNYDTTSVNSNNIVQSSLFCSRHLSCCVYCEENVTISAYEASRGGMVCDDCVKVPIVNPDLETVIILPKKEDGHAPENVLTVNPALETVIILPEKEDGHAPENVSGGSVDEPGLDASETEVEHYSKKLR